jgi:hypothetical protein
MVDTILRNMKVKFSTKTLELGCHYHKSRLFSFTSTEQKELKGSFCSSKLTVRDILVFSKTDDSFP